MSNLSHGTRALLDAAKHDGPSREKREAIWTGVSGSLVAQAPLKVEAQNAGSSSATPGAAKGGAFWAGASMPAVATKAAFIGALFGSAISIGVATFMLRAKTEPVHVPAPTVAQVVAPVAGPVVAATNAQGANTPVANTQSSNAASVNAPQSIELPNDTSETSEAKSKENSGVSSSSSTSGGAAKTSSHAGHGAKKESSTSTESPDELLSRESGLVADARRQLLTGDPAGALKSVRAARSLEARQMEPEEMGLEARALRALGRDAEAERVESSLRSMYPGR